MKRGVIRQSGHIFYEIGFTIGSLASRVLNAAFLRGSMHQTTSARAWLESHPADGEPSRAWFRFNQAINVMFYVLSLGMVTDHTRQARDADVLRLRKALHRYGEGPNPDA